MNVHRLTQTGLPAVLGMALLTACGASGGDADESVVTVYTSRHYGIEEVFERFTDDTGLSVEFITGKDAELRERLAAEGENTPADVFIGADAANMHLAADAGLLRSLTSDPLEGAVPAELRSEDGTWFALSQRARVPVYSTERVDTPPTSYVDLGDPRWAGRLCMRPSTHPYTQSLVAALIDRVGAAETETIVASWVANDPLYIDSDTEIIEAIVAGECDVAAVNSYYLGRLQSEDPAVPVAISWPDQDGRGAHVNLSAGGVTTHAPNPEGGQELLEWMATAGQADFASANFEYPADPTVEPTPIVAAWGEFRADLDTVRELGPLNADAVRLLSAVGYE